MDWSAEILKGLGLAGVVIAALGWAVVRLYTEGEKKNAVILDVNREAVKAISESADAQRVRNDTTDDLIDVIRRQGDAIERLRDAVMDRRAGR